MCKLLAFCQVRVGHDVAPCDVDLAETAWFTLNRFTGD